MKCLRVWLNILVAENKHTFVVTLEVELMCGRFSWGQLKSHPTFQCFFSCYTSVFSLLYFSAHKTSIFPSRFSQVSLNFRIVSLSFTICDLFSHPSHLTSSSTASSPVLMGSHLPSVPYCCPRSLIISAVTVFSFTVHFRVPFSSAIISSHQSVICTKGWISMYSSWNSRKLESVGFWGKIR